MPGPLTDAPAVSVIVLGYQGRSYVDACLTSVLDQDFGRPYEVLFVDNGSTDGTADLAEQYEGVRVHRLARNWGYCQGNNRGAELSRAPLVVFLNQDVVVHRSWLKELVAGVESAPSIIAAQASVVHPWNPEYAAKERCELIGTAYAADLSRLGFVEYRRVPSDAAVTDTLFLSGVSIIVKRQALEEVGGYFFDPDMFAYGEDMDLALRIRTAGHRTVVATRAIVYHDHTLQDDFSVASFVKTVRIIRNRLLALWKSSHWLEFLGLALVTLIGSPFNSGQFGKSARRKALYFALLIPPTLVAGPAALIAMPRYAERRRQTLARRRVGKSWLLRTLLFDRSNLSQARASARAGPRSAGP